MRDSLGNLLFSCLCRSGYYDDELPSVEAYMKTEGPGTNAACKVAEWLGLVTPNSESKLGWKPTTRFVDQVLQRRRDWNRSTTERAAEPWEEYAFTEIWEASIKKGDENCVDREDDVCRFLGFIGLMTVTNDGDWIPTPQLLNLAAASRIRKREKVKK
jgi:hypothetical protein